MISTRRSLWALVVSVAAASVAAVAATAEPARAQEPVATLTGESFLACQGGSGDFFELNCVPTDTGTVEIRARCTGVGSGTISWSATGAAGAPYPDTFTETGEAQLDNGQLETLAVTFSIDSALGQVKGEKFILAPIPFAGTCTRNALVSEFGINAFVRYQATITPPGGGSYHDEGDVTLDLLAYSDQSPVVEEVTTTIGLLTEFFTSDLLFARPLGCPDDDDEDSDGLTNHNESIFATLLGNADSDLDGIKDGNDDANGNGEDDEDEDDDEDDDCPDEDSDGDGEDDEDEDDD